MLLVVEKYTPSSDRSDGSNDIITQNRSESECHLSENLNKLAEISEMLRFTYDIQFSVLSNHSSSSALNGAFIVRMRSSCSSSLRRFRGSTEPVAKHPTKPRFV